jgi:hypothetical protein
MLCANTNYNFLFIIISPRSVHITIFHSSLNFRMYNNDTILCEWNSSSLFFRNPLFNYTSIGARDSFFSPQEWKNKMKMKITRKRVILFFFFADAHNTFHRWGIKRAILKLLLLTLFIHTFLQPSTRLPSFILCITFCVFTVISNIPFLLFRSQCALSTIHYFETPLDFLFEGFFF